MAGSAPRRTRTVYRTPKRAVRRVRIANPVRVRKAAVKPFGRRSADLSGASAGHVPAEIAAVFRHHSFGNLPVSLRDRLDTLSRLPGRNPRELAGILSRSVIDALPQMESQEMQRSAFSVIASLASTAAAESGSSAVRVRRLNP
jgi:hypothetical protein